MATGWRWVWGGRDLGPSIFEDGRIAPPTTGLLLFFPLPEADQAMVGPDSELPRLALGPIVSGWIIFWSDQVIDRSIGLMRWDTA